MTFCVADTVAESTTCYSLTSGTPLFKFKAMHFPGMKKTLKGRQVVGALALVFVFFLPFHFHFSVAPQVAKECSCIHGTRTQLAFHAETPSVTPPLQFVPFAAQYVFSWAGDWSKLENVRGPPAPLFV